MSRRVTYSPSALDQLSELYDYIARVGEPASAERFVSSIVDFCDELATFPYRGIARDDLRPGLRVLGFRRRATIAFTADDATVDILGVFYAGRDHDAILAAGDDPVTD